MTLTPKETAAFIAESYRLVGRQIADGLWRMSYRMHAPVDINGDQSRAVCVQCKEDWPCRRVQRLDDAREKAGHEFLPRG